MDANRREWGVTGLATTEVRRSRRAKAGEGEFLHEGTEGTEEGWSDRPSPRLSPLPKALWRTGPPSPEALRWTGRREEFPRRKLDGTLPKQYADEEGEITEGNRLPRIHAS